MNGDFFYRRLGLRIITIRKAQKLSQEDMSDRAHIDRTYYARIEQGKVNPTVRVLHKIARALKITMSFLLYGV